MATTADSAMLRRAMATERATIATLEDLGVQLRDMLPDPGPRWTLPACLCGHRGHRPEPGIGCPRPGCLCLEPADPAPCLVPVTPATTRRPANVADLQAAWLQPLPAPAPASVWGFLVGCMVVVIFMRVLLPGTAGHVLPDVTPFLPIGVALLLITKWRTLTFGSVVAAAGACAVVVALPALLSSALGAWPWR